MGEIVIEFPVKISHRWRLTFTKALTEEEFEMPPWKRPEPEVRIYLVEEPNDVGDLASELCGQGFSMELAKIS